MTVNKVKKVKRYRGSHTHGGGHKKKRRGAGNRGGRGMAGSGKRADQKKISILKYQGNSYFGKKGFKRPNTKEYSTINLDYIESNLDQLLLKGIAKKKDNKIIIDLKDLGKDKLLGRGKLTNKFEIKVKTASASAISKIEKAGGIVNLSSEKKTNEVKEE